MWRRLEKIIVKVFTNTCVTSLKCQKSLTSRLRTEKTGWSDVQSGPPVQAVHVLCGIHNWVDLQAHGRHTGVTAGWKYEHAHPDKDDGGTAAEGSLDNVIGDFGPMPVGINTTPDDSGEGATGDQDPVLLYYNTLESPSNTSPTDEDDGIGEGAILNGSKSARVFLCWKIKLIVLIPVEMCTFVLVIFQGLVMIHHRALRHRGPDSLMIMKRVKACTDNS